VRADLFDAVEGTPRGHRASPGEPEQAIELVVRTQGRTPAEAQQLIHAFSKWFQS